VKAIFDFLRIACFDNSFSLGSFRYTLTVKQSLCRLKTTFMVLAERPQEALKVPRKGFETK
jgi:hypothetical protein